MARTPDYQSSNPKAPNFRCRFHVKNPGVPMPLLTKGQNKGTTKYRGHTRCDDCMDEALWLKVA